MGAATKEAVARGLETVGVPQEVSRALLTAGKVQRRVTLSVAAAATVMLVALVVMVTGGSGQAIDWDSRYGTARGLLDHEDLMSRDQLRAYQRAALSFNDPAYGGAIPWGLVAAVGQAATEHGKVSPYADDQCDRAPERDPIRYATFTDCDGPVSVFPVTSPPIGDRGNTDQVGLGPLLLARQALSGEWANTNPNVMSSEAGGAPHMVAALLDQARRDMVDSGGWAVPDAGDGEYAKQFWVEAVSRTPLIDPRAAQCATPTIPEGSSPEVVSAAVAALWRCELYRSDLWLVEVSDADAAVLQDRFGSVQGPQLVELYVREALTVADAFSGLTAPPAAACGVMVIPGSHTELTGVTVVADTELPGVTAGLQDRLGGVPVHIVGVDAEMGGLSPSDVLVVAVSPDPADPAGLAAVAAELLAPVPAGVRVVWMLPLDAAGVDVAGPVSDARPGVVVADWPRFAAAAEGLWEEVVDTDGAVVGRVVSAEGWDRFAWFAHDMVLGLPAGSAPVTAVRGDSPAGLFPLSEPIFDAFNPVDGASRCDAGANAHAAVRAFIATETLPAGAEEAAVAPGTPGDRTDRAGRYGPLVGGWWAMPWALGAAELPVLLADGPQQPFTATAACRGALNEWVDAAVLSVGDGHPGVGQVRPGTVDEACVGARPEVLYELAGRAAATKRVVLTSSGQPQSMLGDDGVDEAWVTLLETSPEFADLHPDTPIPPIPPTGENSGSEGDGVAPPVGRTVEAMVARLAEVEAWFAAQHDAVALGPAVAGPDSVLPRLSPTGRGLNPPGLTGSAGARYPEMVVDLAIVFSGLVENDPGFDRDVDVVAAVRGLLGGGFGVGVGGSIAGVPPVAFDAFARAVAWSGTEFAGCELDIPVLAGFARIESGAYWMQGSPSSVLQPDGWSAGIIRGYQPVGADTDGGELDGDATQDWAVGFTQFIPSTWAGYAARYDLDGDRDGIVSPHSFYDGARATAAYVCERVVNPSPRWWDPAVDGVPSIHNEVLLERIAMAYFAGDGGVANAGPLTRSYGPTLVGYVNEFRAAFIPGPSFSGSGPVADAVTYALAQVGKPYCRDDMPGRCSVQPFSQLARQHFGAARFGPDAYDCSGLVTAAYLAAGINLDAYIAEAQYFAVPAVSLTDLQPGDLIFYNGPGGRSIDHVAMYIGDGQIVHARSHAEGVKIDPVSYWQSGIVGAGRPSLMTAA